MTHTPPDRLYLAAKHPIAVIGRAAHQRITRPQEGVEPLLIERDLSKIPAMPDGHYDVSRMDDFQVIAERRRVMANLAARTDQYRALNQAVRA